MFRNLLPFPRPTYFLHVLCLLSTCPRPATCSKTSYCSYSLACYWPWPATWSRTSSDLLYFSQASYRFPYVLPVLRPVACSETCYLFQNMLRIPRSATSFQTYYLVPEPLPILRPAACCQTATRHLLWDLLLFLRPATISCPRTCHLFPNPLPDPTPVTNS